MAIRKEILDELIKDCKNPEQFYGPNGLMKQLTKAVVERMMEAELTEQLGYEKSDPAEKETTNRRNGKTTKTLRTDHGPMEIEVPRDRDGEYEPQVIPKHQREFRGFDDKILSIVDGLSGFPDAINTVFPKTEVQLCMVHMVRNSVKYISYKDRKEITSDLKEIYLAPSDKAAETALERFAEKWDRKYPAISKS